MTTTLAPLTTTLAPMTTTLAPITTTLAPTISLGLNYPSRSLALYVGVTMSTQAPSLTGAASATFAVTAGSLPAGVALDSSTGTIGFRCAVS